MNKTGRFVQVWLGYIGMMYGLLTGIQHASVTPENEAPSEPSNGFVPQPILSSSVGTDRSSQVTSSTPRVDMREDAVGSFELESLRGLPVDLTMDPIDWFPDFNDVSSSWLPIDGNNNGGDAAAVTDTGAVGGLFHSSFNMWNLMDDPVQMPDVNAPA